MRVQRTVRRLAGALTVLAFSATASTAQPGRTACDPVVFIENSAGYLGIVAGGSLGGNSLGSGFVIDAATALIGRAEAAPAGCVVPDDALHIVTNEHVVRSANELQVTFLRELAAGAVEPFTLRDVAIVGVDARVDLGLLRIPLTALAARGLDTTSLRHLDLWSGRPEELPQGLAVQAVGNPRGLKRSVTTGIVSAPQQDLRSAFRYIQTDAAINPGNSGGPLVRSDSGQVVGVNTRAASQSQNLGFAVPVERVRTFLRQVLCEGRREPTHGSLFVPTEAVSERTRAVLGLTEQRGEVVLGPPPPIATSDYGLEPLDVILEIQPRTAGAAPIAIGPGGTPWVEALFDQPPGELVDLVLLRRGQRLRLPVRLESLQDQAMNAERYVEFLGAFLETVPDRLRVHENFTDVGVVIGAIAGGSLAAEAALAPQDVLQRIFVREDERLETHPIDDLDALRAIAPALEERVRRARASGTEMLLGFQVFRLQAQEHAVRFLRVRPTL